MVACETISIEGRYAFADWGKIPLNPTIFAEYKFGVGTIRHEEVMPPGSRRAAMEEEEDGGPPRVPDAYELRLMLADEFFGRFEWAFNAFFEKENTGDRGREWGFAQSAVMPVLLPHEQLKVGVGNDSIRISPSKTRAETPTQSFVIGPTAGLSHLEKHTPRCLAALFG